MQCYLRKIRESWYAVFEFAGSRYTASLKTKSENEAEVLLGPIREALYRLETGRLEIPPGVDHREFILAGGREPSRPVRIPRTNLGDLSTQYGEARRHLESNSRKTIKIHLAHAIRILGSGTPIQSIDLAVAECYASARS